ncbi:MAG: DUF1501 domain-containing protein [Planctomycetaceae bacterium]
MLRLPHHNLATCDGWSRREWMRIGGMALGGLTLPALLAQEAARRTLAAPSAHAATFGKAKSIILIQLLGGPGQHETFDPKPLAPAEVRGPFATIPTSTPGLQVGELMPQIARHTDKLTVLRAMVTDDNAHSSSGYYMLTGVPHVPKNSENATPKFPNLHPGMGAVVRHLQPTVGGIPSCVHLPDYIYNDGRITWPGQDGGWLGRAADPWLLVCDPSADDFKIPDLALPEDVAQQRFQGRRGLREQLESTLAEVERRRVPDGFDEQTRLAYGLLAAPASREAFDLGQESDVQRDAYGRTRFGQSLLLARRLVEAGVRIVQVNWTRLEGKENNGGWDTHKDHNDSMKGWLMPIMDQAVAALFDDLQQRGLLDDTLVAWTGEFGRTPKFNARGGRDHWGKCFSIALGGGGIRGGQVIGESDEHAAYPVSGVVQPEDLTATLFHALGFNPDTELHDPLGRPLPISRGRVMTEFFA